jgi:hypothetical protein
MMASPGKAAITPVRQLNLGELTRCANHPALDAIDVCGKCGKGLCINCKREIHNKTFCQSCAQGMLNQKAEAAIFLADMNERKTSGNYPHRKEGENEIFMATVLCISLGLIGLILFFILLKDTGSKLSLAALGCSIYGFLCTTLLPLCMIILIASPEGQKVLLNIIYVGIAICLLGVVLAVLTLRRNPTPASRRNAIWGLLISITGPILIGILYLAGSEMGS